MTLQTSGAISLGNIQTEFGGSNPASLNEYYRGGSYVSLASESVPTSGAIAHSQFYGARYARSFSLTISAHTTNYNLRSALTSAGWNGSDAVYCVLTINSGIKVGSTSTGTYAFATGSALPSLSLVKIVNNGYILGRGGAGGSGGTTSHYAGYGGAVGGPAMQIQTAVRIENNAYISGGGGGGGGGGLQRYTNPRSESDPYTYYYRSGGGGGGAGYRYGPGGGSSGTNGANGTDGWGGGGAGGSNGTTGGAGGSNGNAGGTGSNGNYGAGAGGGGAGACLSGNSLVTWLATGTRRGSIT